jgi:hypothetical protein
MKLGKALGAILPYLDGRPEKSSWAEAITITESKWMMTEVAPSGVPG